MREHPDPAQLKAAYAGVMRHGAQLLTCWRAGLTTERRRELARFEDKGLELGLQIRAQTIVVILTDSADGVRTLEEIVLAGVDRFRSVVRGGDIGAAADFNARVGDGSYMSGNYLAPLLEALRGLKVVLSPGVTAGKALVIDSGQIELVIVDGFAVAVGYASDDFLENLASILGEIRVIPIFRSVGAALLVTPKAAA